MGGMSYPTAWRSPLGAVPGGQPFPIGEPFGWSPPRNIGPGPYFGAGVFVAGLVAWELIQQLPDSVITYQLPGAYGWTLVQDCGFPPNYLPAASYTTCGLKIVSKSAWEAAPAQNPLTASSLSYWDRWGAVYNATLLRYERCQPAQRWTKGLGLPFSMVVVTPRTAALPVTDRPAAVPYIRERAYDPADRDSSWSWWIPWSPPYVPGTGGNVDYPDVTIAGRATWTRASTRPQVRAIAAATTAEVKTPARSRAAQSFFAMYRAFNFLGDAYGFTRAMWSAIPPAQRGSSRRLDRMGRDLFEWVKKLGHESRDERQDYFMRAAINGARWKMQDTGYGAIQAANFKAMAGIGGQNINAARFASTVDSATRYAQSTWGRSQSSARY